MHGASFLNTLYFSIANSTEACFSRSWWFRGPQTRGPRAACCPAVHLCGPCSGL